MIFLYFLGLFIFLLSNQSLYIFGGDSSEFSFIAKTWGVAHPPGYPFYSLVANLFTHFISFSTIPWRVAIISSFATIATAFILYRLLRELKIQLFSSLITSTLYIFLFPIWSYSEIPEVFTLNNLLVLLITSLLFLFLKKKKPFLLYIAALLFGICISHHHIFVLFAPGWAYLLLYAKKNGILKKLEYRQIVYMGLLGLSGIAFYLYAPIASHFKPVLDWENAQTLNGFIRLITRSTYGTFKAYSGSGGNILNQFFDMFSFLVFTLHDFRVIGLVLIGIGYFRLRKVNSLVFNFLIIATLTHIFFLFYTNFTLITSFTLAMYERFLIPLYLLLMFPFAYGLEYVLIHLTKLISRVIKNIHLKKVANFLIYLFFALYVGIVISQNYQVIKKVPNLNYFAQYAKNLLDTPPKGSIFFVGADNSYFPAIYYHYGQNYRNDLFFIFLNVLNKDYYRSSIKERYPSVFIPGNYSKEADLRSYLEKNKKFGIYLDTPQAVGSWEPYGLLWKYYSNEEEEASDSAQLVKDNTYLWEHVYSIPKLDSELKKILHLNVVQDNYLSAYLNYSKLLFSTKHEKEAEKVIRNILKYKSNDMRTKMILVNLLIYQKECDKAEEIINQVNMNELYKNLDLLPSYKEFLTFCKNNKSETDKVDKLLKENSIKNKSSLMEF